jgi:hypothetical protein
VYYGFSVLDWRAKGLDAASIGGQWGLAVIAEIVLFAVSARFPQRIGSLSLLGAGAFGAVPRWGVMTFNPPLATPRINAAPGAPCGRPGIRHSPGRLCHRACGSHGRRHGTFRRALY